VGQVQGGVEMRVEPGLPPWGFCQRVVGEGQLVLCVVGPPLRTKEVLGSDEARARVNKAGKKALAAFADNPTLESLFRLGKQFSIDAGLATEPVLRAIRAVEREGGVASQAMLGHSVFAYGAPLATLEAALKPFGATWASGIEPTGARLAEVQRAKPAESGP